MSESASASADKYADYSREQLLAEINRLKKNKKYGLVWEHKKEQVIEDFETQQPYLQEVTEKRIENAPGEPTNLIIEGDNFEALSILNYTHAGKVDVIYIDPPYNTGNKDFIYNDNYVDSEDEFRHSKWLSFMEPRLKLAKNLLKDDGVIFISIDDNEQYQLKILCDEILGERNFVSAITVESGEVFGTKAAHVNKTFVKVKDYILVYLNDKSNCSVERRPLVDEMRELYDSHYGTIIEDDLSKTSLIDYLKADESLKVIFGKYSLPINKEGINKLMQIDEGFRNFFFNDLSKKLYADAPYSRVIPNDVIGKYPANTPFKYDEKLLFKTSSGSVRMYICFRENLRQSDDYESKYTRCTYRGDLWKGFHYDMRNIDDEGSIKFKSGKKPSRLVRQLVKWANKKNAVVLDFFAGSGTTGHAVLELNKEDGGHRQFILCTNNGDKGPDSVKIAEDITYPRIKTVITGKRQDGSKYSDGILANLRYYKIEHKEKKASIDANRLEIVRYLEDIIQVKENAFEQIEVNEDLALYKNSERFVGMVFEPFALEEIIESIKEKNSENKPVKLYVFSYSRDAFEDNYGTDFEIEFVAMPEGLLKTYANIVAETKKEDA